MLSSTTRSLLALLVLSVACGDDSVPTADGSGTTGPNDPSSSTTSSSGVADTTTTPPSDTSGPSSSGPGDSGSTNATSTTSSDSGASSDSTGPMQGTTTDDPGNVVYSALALPGGLDRIRIHKADLDEDRCTWVVLVAPELPNMFPNVTVPAGWSVESVTINDVAAACSADSPSMFGGEGAVGGNGTVTFGMVGGSGFYPCTIDIDAVFDFAGMLPGIPMMDAMVAAAVPVAGC